MLLFLISNSLIAPFFSVIIISFSFKKKIDQPSFKFITCENYNFIPLKYDMSYPNLLKNNLIKTSNNINVDFNSVKYLRT